VLKGLHNALSLRQSLSVPQLREIARLQHELRLIIAELKRRTRAQYRADAVAVLADFIHRLDHVGVRLLPPPALPTACIMPEDLTGVLDELVQNALQHANGKPAAIDLRLQKAHDEIWIEVKDRGPGIPKDLWDKIFELGFTTKKSRAGGFGLYHTRQLLKKYGGEIFVAASELGEGTTMRICLKAEA
jgi:signal transduction histidine kinase